ncbi:MAG: YbjN domain-containing protein [Gammaproteobacteria bacterium]
MKTLVALMCTVMLSPAVNAADAVANVAQEIVDATNPEQLVKIIQDLGYRAKLEIDGDGDPMIRSSVGGTQFAVVFYGCSERHDQCQILLFKAGYEMDKKIGMDVINQWNATRLFGRAYLDEVSDPWIELVLNVHGGVTRRQFENTFEWWESSVGEFEDEIGT